MKIAVIGASNVDISARSLDRYVPRDSNPSKITVSFGGVGRNVAHDLVLLGQEVCFFSAFADDPYGRELRENCLSLGMDLSQAILEKNGRTSIYLCINNERGDLEAGASDMALTDRLTYDYVRERIGLLNTFDAVVFDTNLQEETIREILQNCSAPLFLDTVSCKKASKLKNVFDGGRGALHPLYALKTNRREAEVLTGMRIASLSDAEKAVKTICEQGCQRAFLTMGEQGACCFDGKELLFLEPCAGEIVSSMGAGDAFLAALVFAYAQGESFRRSAMLGLAASSLTLRSPNAVHPALSGKTLYQQIQNGEKKE